MKLYVNSDHDLERKRKWLKNNPILAGRTPITREIYPFVDENPNDNEFENSEEEPQEQLSLAEEASAQMFFAYMRDMKERGIDPNSKEAHEEMQKVISSKDFPK